MKTDDELILSFYRELNTIGDKKNVHMVQHIENKHIYIKKILSARDKELYISLKNLNVSGIPEIFYVIENGDKLIVIEEYINGRTLKSMLSESGRLDYNSAANIIVQLCDILSILHNASPSIIHRDIKPENIIIAPDNKVYLIDFNASKRFDPDKNYDTVLMGTVEYAAPEQFGFGQSDPRTDIYALGVLLNVMLTGYFPKEKLYDGKLSAVISKCVNIDPAKRYNSVLQLSGALSFERAPLWFLPPGFRTRKLWKAILASIAYLFTIYLCATLKVENETNVTFIYANRIAAFLLLLSFILIIFNYGNIHMALPITRSRNPVIKSFGVLIWCAAGLFIIVILLAVFEMLLS